MEIKAREITLFPTSKLSEYPKNANIHTDEQIDEIIQLIEFYGHRDPLIVDVDIQPDGTHWVMAGNGRLQAAKKAGWENLPIIFQKFNSDEEKYGFMVSHNAVSSFGWGGGLDLAKINMDIIDLGPELDVKMLGIKDFVIEPIEKFEPQTDEDEVPDVVHPITRKGDIWILGNHRLMCGDSTMIDDVEKLMNGEKADMVFTSPPYNGDTHLDYGKGENKKLYDNNTDKWTSEEYIDFCYQVLANLFNFTSGFIFWNVNYNAKSRFEYVKCIYPFIENLWETIIWKKTGMPLSNGLTRNFEFIFCFKNGERKHLSREFKTESNIWDISNIGSQDKNNHRACFPVGLPERGIINGSNEGQTVLEPFAGSGTTIIACEKTNRKCYGMELDEKYCDVIINRWMNYTGKKAVLESTNQTYEELKLERGE